MLRCVVVTATARASQNTFGAPTETEHLPPCNFLCPQGKGHVYIDIKEHVFIFFEFETAKRAFETHECWL